VEVLFKIPFLQRAGLMTFEHRKPDHLDYHCKLPIVLLTLDSRWDPQEHSDDNGEMIITPLEQTSLVQSSGITASLSQIPPTKRREQLSFWHHSETCSTLHPHGEAEELSFDASSGTDRQFYGNACHLAIPQHWRRYRDSPTIHFMRQYHVDEFLNTLSYSELLGFLPDDPAQDSYIFALREANAFRLLCKDPQAFIAEDDLWFESQSDMTGGDPDPDTGPCSDWNLNQLANHPATATANWASTKHQYSEDDLQRIRPWLAWIPVESVKKTLENTTQRTLRWKCQHTKRYGVRSHTEYFSATKFSLL
jgi:hypothetical protein